MKKLISVMISSIIFSSAVFAEDAALTNKPETITPALNQNPDMALVASEEQSIPISKEMKIISKAEHKEDPKLYYTIQVSYPQIQGKLTEGAKQFNFAIEKMVQEELIEFKKLVSLDMIHMRTLPEEVRKNSLKVDYDIDLVKPKNQPIVSVRMSFEGMQAGRPHPFHNNRVINFDLNSGKSLSLNTLFKHNSKFLKLLASYTSKVLNDKLKHDNWMVAQGTKPDVKNFRNWNLQSDSILITFDEYQVAPYVYGAQEVEIPYSELKKVLSVSAPIAACANSATGCQA